jgi:hypothetical protein
VRWRLIICLAALGIGLIVWGVVEWRLGAGASATPEPITLKQLIARGPQGNPNILLREYELGDDCVINTRNGAWNGVYVPVFPAGEANVPGGFRGQARPVKAVIFSLNVHNDAEIGTVLRKPELHALVTNRIRSLGSEERNLLQQKYGGIDVNTCLIIQEGRTTMGVATLALMFGGGILLLCGAVGVVVAGFYTGGARKRPAFPRKPRRQDDDEEDDRPRRRRREDEEEDEDDRPRRKRSRDDEAGEDDEPRRKRRRSREDADE